MRDGRDVLVCGVEGIWVAGAGSKERPGEGAVGGQQEEDGSVSDGLGASGGSVAVDDAVGGEGTRVDPVEAGAGAGVDLARGREEVAGAGQDRSATQCVWNCW